MERGGDSLVAQGPQRYVAPLHMEPIYGLDQLLAYFKSKGLALSRQAFYQSHFPILKEFGYAKEVAPRRWVFYQPEMTHWAEYVLEARKRVADGRLPGDYEYDSWDCTQFREGNLWDEDE